MFTRNRAIALVALAPLLGSCNGDRSTQPANVDPQFITYGSIDENNTYSNTGAFIVQSPNGTQIFPICSGTLISETVFLTAAHCVTFFHSLQRDGWTGFVSFDAVIPFGALTTRRTRLIAIEDAVANPAYSQRQSDSGDIAVLVLAANGAHGITPAALPVQGLLDQLFAAGILQTGRFTAVGYGVQERVTGGGVPYHQDLNPIPRMYSFSSFNALGPGYLRLSQNPAKGDGGTCFGDSGGPNFLTVAGRQTLVASTVTGDAVCRATNVVYRLDTASARAFLATYVTLP